MDPRVEQYNAAGNALNAAVERVRSANDADMPAAEQSFRDAQAEFARCESNLRTAEAAAAVLPFTPRAQVNPNELGMDAREVRQYSIVRAINALVTRDWSGAELEREASEAIAKRMGREAQGFFLPTDIQQRDLVVGTPSAGGDTVATTLMPSSFMTLLRKRMVTREAGATVLGGLQGDIAIPRQTGGATYYWLGESGAPTKSQQAVDQVKMSPKGGGAYTDISHKLLRQSSIDVENFVTTDLATVCALGIDLAAMHGTGTNDQPKGVAATAAVGSVVGGANGAAPTFGNVVDLETEVAIDNADLGSLAYIVNAKSRGYFKKTPIIPTYEADMIWDRTTPEAPLNGYKTHVSNQVSSALTKGTAAGICSALFFGNWADLIIGQWGTVDIMVDPYTGSTSGTVRVVALQDVDIAVRHAESFAVMLDALC